MAATDTVDAVNPYSTITLINPPSDPDEAWASQKDYGHWVSYYCLCTLALITLWHWLRKFLDYRTRRKATKEAISISRSITISPAETPDQVSKRWSNITNTITAPTTTTTTTASPPSASSSTLHQRLKACIRSLTYRRIPFAISKHLPTSSMPSSIMAVFLILSTAFLIGLVISKQNFYNESLRFGAPPLSLRSALMATAMLPAQVALAGKANIVTWLTGIGHERLNVVHRWAGWASLGLGLAHAMPYFWASEREFGRKGYEKIFDNFYKWIGPGVPYSGMPAILCLGAICILSLYPLRRRAYEMFYYLHILLGIGYVGGLMWHTYDLVDSWLYIYATLLFWFTSWVWRLLFNQTATSGRSTSFLRPFRATLEPLAGNATRVRVWLGEGANKFTWTPGQHVFVRFVEIGLSESHPFTIASACETDAAEGTDSGRETSTTARGKSPYVSASEISPVESSEEDKPDSWEGEKGDILPELQPISPLEPAFKHSLRLGRSISMGSHSGPPSPLSTFARRSPSAGSSYSRAPKALMSQIFDQTKQVVFLIRTRGGMTKRLAAYTKANADDNVATARVFLDGPFGGIDRPLDLLYDTLVLVAGGSGVTAATSWMSHVASAWGSGRKPRAKRIVFIWALRTSGCVEWVEETLSSALVDARRSRLHLAAGDETGLEITAKFFVTKKDYNEEDEDGVATDASRSTARAGVERSDTYSTMVGQSSPRTPNFGVGRMHSTTMSVGRTAARRLMALGKVEYCRPDLVNEIQNAVLSGERAFVLGCGPDPFRIDLGNAVAGAQKRVMSGECEEIALHLESMGW